MEIKTYTNNSDPFTVNKDLTVVSTYTNCEMKEDSSIIDPVFLLSGAVSSFAAVNYVYVASFNRYYYVRNIESEGNGMVRLTCHVDVRMSFKGEFLELPAVVSRQEENYNLYLDDGSFMTYANPHVVTREFPSGFATPCYLLTLAGGKN